ncbi:Guanine nucleotide-binding protein, beta subunit [Parasponia andersonii]|uniref:Guanine nucleotide-binding protein, beta subunit n=1 Tax=Parasponia andersonii TaxID=3476 RepID=A0A2P5DG15_PARAD|nr:Guanine nucleotide-binding protein, beta subunit [Parasponia andersonii]
MDVAHCYLDSNADAVEFCQHGSYHHVLAASTYTLQEGDQPTRFGSISLFAVDAETCHLEPLHRVETAGIFDIKWNPVGGNSGPLLAQADADGSLRIHALKSSSDGSQGFSLGEINALKVSSSMCLYLDWNPSATDITVGLSDGSVAITSLVESQLEVKQEWKAHDFELWTTSFDIQQPHLVYTGSDDCKFSGWDLREGPPKLAFHNSKAHKMGVCCIAKSPSDPNTLLTGSYDENLRLWDLRSISKPVNEASLGLGGGVWRIKHHPFVPGLVLSACMHNGFAIVKFKGGEAEVTERYSNHESLAYGADWHRGEPVHGGERKSSLVATCSFYDRLLRIWKPEKSCNGSEVSVKFLKAPHAFSHLNSATFVFEVFQCGNGSICGNCSYTCRVDGGIASNCETRKVSYLGMQDGPHTFEVCTNGLEEVGCASYNWTIDTVSPTAYVTASSSFTNAIYFSVNITFSEPCTGGGGFTCVSANACNLLVYGAGKVIPTSLNVLQPNLTYSLVVGLSSQVEYGRVILVMDKNFCTDNAGNRFTRTANSSFFVHFDRRNVFVNLRIHILERLVQLNGQTRTVLATNDYSHLKVYLYFSEPVLNSSTEILNSLNISQGVLLPINGKNYGNRRFGFMVEDISNIAIVTLSLNSNLIISRQGTPASPISPVTFLYDSQRPAVKLSTTSSMRTRTREHNIPISIIFMKPVFGFNSSYLSVSGGHVQSFQQISLSTYIIDIKASNDIVSINVPENVTGDVAGNKNLASNVLQVKHYSVPLISSVISALVTASFLATSLAAGILTFSTASLQNCWTFRGPSSLTTYPARNLFRIACHIQVFALSRWLAVMLPVEYYEFARGLQWSIPYFDLPWENGHSSLLMVGSSPFSSSSSHISEIYDSENFQNLQQEEENSNVAAQVYGLPLDPMEYRLYFKNHNIKPEAEYLLDPQNSNGWKNFDRGMFWLGLIGGGLVFLHVLLIFILKLRKKSSENQKGYGALTFPRFEIFLFILALPCLSEVSAALAKGKDSSGVIVGVLLLGIVSILLLSLLVFLSFGITFGKLLQYKEVHREGRRFHWYQELIRVTLGPGKRGQWTWKRETNSLYLIILGPLYEDLRGPPKYMLSQISGSHKHGDRIIASDDETEDAEAPFIQKLFGVLRIYYTLLECMKRVSLGIMAGVYMENWSSKTPSLTLLCVTSFQLFFLVLKKPFIKKKVQLVEIISVASEVGLFASCVTLLGKEFSSRHQTKVGIFMVILFLVGYISQIINEWYTLYRQTMLLDPAEKSFLTGLRIASVGCILLFIPQKFIQKLENKFSHPRQGERDNTVPSAEGYKSSSRSSGSTEKPWLIQLREMAKASFSKEASGSGNNDPSTSRSGWSGIWGTKRSGSSSVSSSSDFKSKPKSLYKDLDAIFAS